MGRPLAAARARFVPQFPLVDMQHGQVKPILVNARNNQIVAGNGTFRAATERLGWTHLAVVYKELSDEQQRSLSIADNRTAELADWDQDVLDAQLVLVQEDTPELYADLLLDDLTRRIDDGPGRKQSSGQTAAAVESYQVVVECSDEDDQKALYETMQEQGRRCRLLTM